MGRNEAIATLRLLGEFERDMADDGLRDETETGTEIIERWRVDATDGEEVCGLNVRGALDCLDSENDDDAVEAFEEGWLS